MKNATNSNGAGSPGTVFGTSSGQGQTTIKDLPMPILQSQKEMKEKKEEVESPNDLGADAFLDSSLKK